MGEKEIVEDPGEATTGGGVVGVPMGGGTTDGGGQPHGPGIAPGGGLTTQERPYPCRELNERARDLLAQLEGLHEQNREQTQRALRAFFGDPKSNLHDGYAHWFTQAKITEAVVDANNATGKTLIDVALFALGGWGGIGKMSAPAGTVSKLEKLFGTGLGGSKDFADAVGRIGIKVLEKAGDEMAGAKAGKIGVTAAKTIDKWHDPQKWFQAPLSGVESVVRGAVLNELGGWMKSGATAGALGRAQTSYADFFAAAMGANTSAAAAMDLERQLRELNLEARAKNCPEAVIPDYVFHTFAPTQFGAGAFKGQSGPTMHSHSIASGIERDWDLFANVNNMGSLPF